MVDKYRKMLHKCSIILERLWAVQGNSATVHDASHCANITLNYSALLRSELEEEITGKKEYYYEQLEKYYKKGTEFLENIAKEL